MNCEFHKGLLLLASLCASVTVWSGDFRFNNMYSSHMVIQRDEPVRVCGFADAGRAVTVRFRGTTARTTATADGRWSVTLPAGRVGGPFVLEASSEGETMRLDDVLVGDVWFCTGQSNMWWPLKDSGSPEKEIAAADHPNIRLLDVALTGAEEETDEPPYVRGWSRCTPVTARSFSACGYHFACAVRERLGDVPIGLVGAGWGGPPISHFLPPRKNGNTNYLATARAAMFAAAKGFAEEDRLRAACRTLFADETASAARANEAPDTTRGGTVELPAKKGLEHTILDKFAGAVHFRRTFELDDGWTARASVLTLGQGILPGLIYVNGRKVGAMKEWGAPIPGARGNLPWKFEVPSGLLKKGANRIDVLLGCNDRLSWWGAFYGTLALTDGADPARRVALDGVWTYDRFVEIPTVPRTYGGSWCARIHPFFAMPVKGVLFYQGEADSKRPCADYLADHKRLIGLLREGWGKPALPYYCMQLANHAKKRNVPTDNGFCEVREAQRLTAEEVPGCGTAVSIDIGDDLNIHPANKREQGHRLALQALAKTYGCTDIVADGPRFDRLVREGGATFVAFKPSTSALVVRGAELTGFEARAKDGVWTRVKAEIADDRVKLSAPFAIEDVRYLWQNYPEPDAALFNAAGLPAGPFRSCK